MCSSDAMLTITSGKDKRAKLVLVDPAPGNAGSTFEIFNDGAQEVCDLPCTIRREGGQSLVIGGPSLVLLEGNACNPF